MCAASTPAPEMCGLVGLAGASLRDEVESVLPLIAHRGPDGHGVYADEFVTLGHCRLAVIDPAAGAQPFVDPAGRYVLVYNGELYNYRELAKRLQSLGYSLSTQCDTEVLALWLAHFGEAGLADLNGMFAFAFWDRRDRTLLLARDRMGIKPLYLARTGGVLVFGSEIKAMLPFLARCEADLSGVFEFVTFQQGVSERTVFQGISKLSPGRWLRWTPDRVTEGAFWTIPTGESFAGSHADAVDAYRSLLASAVQRQMVSDVPLGSHLSSGLDSSAVATIAATQSVSPLQVFTGAFTDSPYYDERVGARAVASNIGGRAHEIEITPDDFMAHFARLVWHLEEPTLGTGALPQYMVSKLAAEHVKVVLTGHGGDELFAGYQVNKAALVQGAYRRGPLAALSAVFSIRPDELTRVLYFLVYPMMFPEVRLGLFVMTPERSRPTTLSAEFLNSVRHHDPVAALRAKLPKGADFGQTLLHTYLTTYLPTLFCQEDKVGMAHSLEARIPICDNELVEFACRLSLSQKLHRGRLKAVPRDALRGIVPDMILSMPKRGFPTPFARWFRGPLKDFIADLLLSQRARARGLFNPTQIESWFEGNRRARFDTVAHYVRANRLYSAALIEQWFRTFIDGERPAAAYNLPKAGAFAAKLL